MKWYCEVRIIHSTIIMVLKPLFWKFTIQQMEWNELIKAHANRDLPLIHLGKF